MNGRQVTATIRRINWDSLVVRVRRSPRDELALPLGHGEDCLRVLDGAQVGGRVLCRRRTNDPYLRIEHIC
jgi:hypothetical protein